MADEDDKQNNQAPEQGEPEQQAGENRPEAGNQRGVAKGKKRKGQKGQTEHPASREKRDAEENAPSPVQPVQVVRNKPEVGDEEAEEVVAANKPNLQQDKEQLAPIEEDKSVHKARDKASSGKDLCWNCANNGEKSVLDSNGVCSNCGFEKDKLYNLELEARKAQAREAAAAEYHYN